MFRKPDKPQLARAILDHLKDTGKILNESIPHTEHYVLDGGTLLHRVPWKNESTYGAIAKSYASFTIRHYGKATVVLDGYNGGPSFKDITHHRRLGQKVHPVVSFSAKTELAGKREDFLSRNSNKQGLIDLISCELKKGGCQVINSPGDADVDIAKAAVEASHHHSTTLIGEDTDPLILLLYYVQSEGKDLCFRSDK